MDEQDFWQQYPAVRQQISARQVDADKVVLNLAGGNFFTLNEVGAFLWDNIDGRHNLQAILEKVLAEYEVDEATARTDVNQIIGELVREKLIELHDQPVTDA